MLRFFEPEAEHRWPFFATASMEFGPSPRLAGLPGEWDEFRVPGVQDSLLSSLVSFFGSENIAGNEEYSRTPSSNPTTEINRVYFSVAVKMSFDGGLFIKNMDVDSFQLGDFSPPTTMTLPAQFNCIPGIGDNFMALRPNTTTAAAAAATTTPPPYKATSVKRLQNHTRQGESKRQKATPCMQRLLPSPPLSVKPASSPPVKMPTRKSQKLGDKVTALQQLVSPFGKTDTASVLHEASIYIKALHEQIQRLSTPFFGAKSLPKLQGLCRRGLCLAPISPAIVALTEQAPLLLDRRPTGQGSHLL